MKLLHRLSSTPLLSTKYYSRSKFREFTTRPKINSNFTKSIKMNLDAFHYFINYSPTVIEFYLRFTLSIFIFHNNLTETDFNNPICVYSTYQLAKRQACIVTDRASEMSKVYVAFQLHCSLVFENVWIKMLSNKRERNGNGDYFWQRLTHRFLFRGLRSDRGTAFRFRICLSSKLAVLPFLQARATPKQRSMTFNTFNFINRRKGKCLSFYYIV